jgi:hypothetical protein
MEHTYKKVTFDFPEEEFMYLKMSCARQGVSLKEFLTKSTIESVENYEDDLLCIKMKNSPEYNEPGTPWEEVQKRLGWDQNAFC